MAIPENMHALVQNTSGFATELSLSALESLDPYVTAETIPTPKPRRGEVLIQVRMAPINPSDVAFIKGMYGQPRVAGHTSWFRRRR